jgi:hypothetical protein
LHPGATVSPSRAGIMRRTRRVPPRCHRAELEDPCQPYLAAVAEDVGPMRCLSVWRPTSSKRWTPTLNWPIRQKRQQRPGRERPPKSSNGWARRDYQRLFQRHRSNSVVRLSAQCPVCQEADMAGRLNRDVAPYQADRPRHARDNPRQGRRLANAGNGDVPSNAEADPRTKR